MQTGILDKVPAHCGGNGGYIADMLHHGSQRDGHDGNQRSNQHLPVPVAQDREYRLIPVDGQPHPLGVLKRCKVYPSQHCRQQIGTHHTNDNGNDLDHTFSPDITDDHQQNGCEGDEPVGSAAVNSGRGQRQADGNDNGSGDDGREELHHPARAKKFNQQRQQQIQKT